MKRFTADPLPATFESEVKELQEQRKKEAFQKQARKRRMNAGRDEQVRRRPNKVVTDPDGD